MTEREQQQLVNHRLAAIRRTQRREARESPPPEEVTRYRSRHEHTPQRLVDDGRPLDVR